MGGSMKVSIGCGMKKPEGFIGVDVYPYKNVEHVLNVGSQKLPFEDNCVDEIEADNIYEHLTSEQLFYSMSECWRVLKPEGFLFVKVPLFGTKAWLMHPDHKLHWTEDMFGFFAVPDNEGTIDPHGYINHFWYLEFINVEEKPEEAIWCKMYPNKIGSPKGYKKVTREEDR